LAFLLARVCAFCPRQLRFRQFRNSDCFARADATLDIRFVSTLTADDEERIAGVLLNVLVKLLEDLPIAYALRIETTGAKIFQQSNMSDSDVGAESESDANAPPGSRGKHLQ
jgi:hypothetical protein